MLSESYGPWRRYDVVKCGDRYIQREVKVEGKDIVFVDCCEV